MAKTVTIILPAGIAVWPKLDQVDVYQPIDKKGRPSGAAKRRFIARVKYNDEDRRKVDDFLKQCLKNFNLEDGKLPWKKDKKTGELTLEATSGEKYRPPVFDAKNSKVPAKVIIGGGSTIKLDVTVNPYTAFGGGINLYINSVQLLDLKQRDGNRFEETEGFTCAGDDEDEDEADDSSTSRRVAVRSASPPPERCVELKLPEPD
jgi:hypothetical protein